jgi:hypothetical protein
VFPVAARQRAAGTLQHTARGVAAVRRRAVMVYVAARLSAEVASRTAFPAKARAVAAHVAAARHGEAIEGGLREAALEVRAAAVEDVGLALRPPSGAAAFLTETKL